MKRFIFCHRNPIVVSHLDALSPATAPSQPLRRRRFQTSGLWRNSSLNAVAPGHLKKLETIATSLLGFVEPYPTYGKEKSSERDPATLKRVQMLRWFFKVGSISVYYPVIFRLMTFVAKVPRRKTFHSPISTSG